MRNFKAAPQVGDIHLVTQCKKHFYMFATDTARILGQGSSIDVGGSMNRRLMAALATIPLVAAGLVASVAAPASANCGSHPWTNRDGDTGFTLDRSPIRTGPHESCAVVRTVPASTSLFYHCFTVNESGNTWTHVRIAGTQTFGWVFDDHLNDHGSFDRC
jgi:hypothetical protein